MAEIDINTPNLKYDAKRPRDTRGSEVTGSVGAIVGADTGFPNPMGGVQNTQMAYHLHQYGNLVSQPRSTKYIH